MLSKANMFDSLMQVCQILTTGITAQITAIESRWTRQSNLIYLAQNGTDTQVRKANDELARLLMNYKKPDGYAQNYWADDYSQ